MKHLTLVLLASVLSYGASAAEQLVENYDCRTKTGDQANLQFVLLPSSNGKYDDLRAKLSIAGRSPSVMAMGLEVDDLAAAVERIHAEKWSLGFGDGYGNYSFENSDGVTTFTFKGDHPKVMTCSLNGKKPTPAPDPGCENHDGIAKSCALISAEQYNAASRVMDSCLESPEWRALMTGKGVNTLSVAGKACYGIRITAKDQETLEKIRGKLGNSVGDVPVSYDIGANPTAGM